MKILRRFLRWLRKFLFGPDWRTQYKAFIRKLDRGDRELARLRAELASLTDGQAFSAKEEK